ncbi:cytochrome b [Pseudomonas sp. LMG 31766]|jgi:cytochrome b561|uniref:Cytochrome b n=1 Tax=Pseudomonas chaetocerotis TaxID=2758695 RepID=A0A931CYZ5_9PSED|nr:cytochrome b [Pseudomonas chaetocerotis]MBZ9666423.1 cytochrome b [Pseudomonas chaetocerotis]
MSNLQDSAQRYGAVSRLLHWAMAALLVWQYLTVIVPEGHFLESIVGGTHKATGLLLMVLVVIRLLWALYNSSRRPAPVSVLARFGHLALYGLLFVIPFVALLRQYGSGREFVAFGMTIMPGFSDGKIEWMIAPASLLHGNLGWLLLFMVIGHAAMAFIHRRQGGEDVLARMIGR